MCTVLQQLKNSTKMAFFRTSSLLWSETFPKLTIFQNLEHCVVKGRIDFLNNHSNFLQTEVLLHFLTLLDLLCVYHTNTHTYRFNLMLKLPIKYLQQTKHTHNMQSQSHDFALIFFMNPPATRIYKYQNVFFKSLDQ